MKYIGEKRKRKEKRARKLIRFAFFVLLVFFLSGASLVVIDRYLFPYLATVSRLEKYKLFKKITEDVVVVNKTEQVNISEDQTVSRYSNKSASSVVEIISLKRDAKGLTKLGSSQIKYGSGLIVTADGLVLTSREAIFGESAEYKIFTEKGKYFRARLAAVDDFTNLTFLKIDGAPDLPVASFIAPEDMKVGARAVAIGRSGNDFQPIFKSGLVSEYASDFSLAGAVPFSDKMQGAYFADFDMREAGDEKSVGGAVTDYNGDVIGILGARKSADHEQYFIVPVSFVRELINRFISTGSVKRGALGTYYLPLSTESAAISGGLDKGALVFSPSGQQGLAVMAGSAAEKAGIRVGDVIASVNGEEVNQEDNLAELVSRHKPGEKVELKILRDKQEAIVSVVLQ